MNAEKVFKKLEAQATKHRAPDFRQLVIRKARKITEKQKTAKYQPLLEDRFYSYVLLDSTKPGRYKYVIKDLTLRFEYEPFYIGKGTFNRMHDHVKGAHNGEQTHRAKRIRKIERLGGEAIVMQLSQPSVEAVALAEELLLIKHIGRRNKSNGPLTNVSMGGDGLAGVPKSAEHRAKLSYPKSAETKAKLRAANLGKTHSAETKAKLSAVGKGRAHTDEHRQAISAALKGKKKSAEHKANISAAKIGAELTDKQKEALDRLHASRVGKKHTEETREKMRKAAAGHYVSQETREKMSKARKGKPQQRLTCPHCNLTSGIGAIKRYHLDNCQDKPVKVKGKR